MESKSLDKDIEEAVSKQLMIDKNDMAQRFNESSLGILKNMSSCEFFTTFFTIIMIILANNGSL